LPESTPHPLQPARAVAGSANGPTGQAFFIVDAPPAAAAPMGRRASCSATIRFCAGVSAWALIAIAPVVMASRITSGVR